MTDSTTPTPAEANRPTTPPPATAPATPPTVSAPPAHEAPRTAPAQPPAQHAPEATTPAAKPDTKTPTTTSKEAQKRLDPVRRARRGATVAGAIALPLASLGFALLAVPLAIWQLATIVKTIVVVVANAVQGRGAAADANATLGSIDPNAMSSLTIALAIVGAVLLLAGALVSTFVLRGHGVARPTTVTALALPMGAVVAAIVTGTIGALGGLLFGTSVGVREVLGNAAIGLAAITIGSVIATVITGSLVWLWVARLFRAPEERADR